MKKRRGTTGLSLVTDIVGSLAIGIDNVFLMLGDLGTILDFGLATN